MDAIYILLIVFFTVVGIPIYFLPTIIATNRKHPNALPIFILNFFLGWSLIGWVAALIWSLIALPSPKKEFDPRYTSPFPFRDDSIDPDDWQNQSVEIDPHQVE